MFRDGFFFIFVDVQSVLSQTKRLVKEDLQSRAKVFAFCLGLANRYRIILAFFESKFLCNCVGVLDDSLFGEVV